MTRTATHGPCPPDVWLRAVRSIAAHSNLSEDDSEALLTYYRLPYEIRATSKTTRSGDSRT